MTVLISEVGPRDGLQNEAEVLDPQVRAEMVNRLAATGLRRIEAASFVRDDAVPQMAQAESVVAGIVAHPGVDYAGLVLNRRGFDRLLTTSLTRVNANLAVTDSFNRRNANASLAEATALVKGILASTTLPTTVTISAAFGCPFEGRVAPAQVMELATQLDADEIVLADTIGVATPRAVTDLIGQATKLGKPIGAHFHNTRNTGLANAIAALAAGAALLDSSLAGIGGCPFAPRATGNIPTEDLVYLLEGEGVTTGVDLDGLIRVSVWLEGVLGRPLPGLLYRAGNWPG